LDREGLPVCLDEGEDFIFRSEANRIAFFWFFTDLREDKRKAADGHHC
jgi:hypothetical protein